MKNALILHGTGGTPESHWLPSIRRFLENRGYEAWVPALPNPNKPDLAECLPLILNGMTFSEETIIVSHSAGCPLALSILEHLNTAIHKAVLVAGYAQKLHEDDNPKILQPQYDWEKIKRNVKDLIFIHSTNDPWDCDEKEGLRMFAKLGGTIIIREGEGHCGSDSFQQPYTRFPLLEKLLELKYSRSSIDGSDKE